VGSDGVQGAEAAAIRGSPWEVLLVFLRLGLTSFGGPVAHIGYFRHEFVSRRRWLGERAFADLVALCQFLPGPASSQLGFSIGLLRAGYAGALAAWTGFTLPSAVAMTLFAAGAGALRGAPAAGLLHGLKLAAVAVVAQAVWGMARSACAGWARAAIAVAAAAAILLIADPLTQIGVIVGGALAGLVVCREIAQAPVSGEALLVSRRTGLIAGAAFLTLLVGLPVAAQISRSPTLRLFQAVYHSGALVFGGGHVVLPLLRQQFVDTGWMDNGTFLAGYGAAQAMPGPLFTVGAYLGFAGRPVPGPVGAALGLVGLFLPGLLILLAALPFWARLKAGAGAQAAMRGVNAAVVGLLAATLYSPLWTTSVRGPADAAVALAGFGLLTFVRLPPIAVVTLCAGAGMLLG